MLSNEKDQIIERFESKQEKIECLAKEKQSLQTENKQLKMKYQQWQVKESNL